MHKALWRKWDISLGTVSYTHLAVGAGGIGLGLSQQGGRLLGDGDGHRLRGNGDGAAGVDLRNLAGVDGAGQESLQTVDLPAGVRQGGCCVFAVGGEVHHRVHGEKLAGLRLLSAAGGEGQHHA